MYAQVLCDNAHTPNVFDVMIGFRELLRGEIRPRVMDNNYKIITAGGHGAMLEGGGGGSEIRLETIYIQQYSLAGP